MSPKRATIPASPRDAPTRDVSPKATRPDKVVLRTPEPNFELELRLPDPGVTMEMRLRLRNRVLWREVPSPADLIGRPCTELLSSLHCLKERLQRLGREQVVEVSLPGNRPGPVPSAIRKRALGR